MVKLAVGNPDTCQLPSRKMVLENGQFRELETNENSYRAFNVRFYENYRAFMSKIDHKRYSLLHKGRFYPCHSIIVMDLKKNVILDGYTVEYEDLVLDPCQDHLVFVRTGKINSVFTKEDYLFSFPFFRHFLVLNRL